MQAARHAAKQLVQRSVAQLKSVRGMASDASSEKAHMDEALKEMSKWYDNIVQQRIWSESCRSSSISTDATGAHAGYLS